MDPVFDVTDRNTAIETELASLVDIHGLSLLDESGRLRRLLSQACPDAPQQVAVIGSALSAGVPARLRAAKDDDSLPALLRQQVDALQAQGLLDRDWSVWAVRAWAHALALPTRGLDGVGATVTPPPPQDESAPPAAPWSTPRPDDTVAPARRGPEPAPFASALDAAFDGGSADVPIVPLVEPLFSEEDLQRIAEGGPARVGADPRAARDDHRATLEPSVAAAVPLRVEPMFAPEELRVGRSAEPKSRPSARWSRLAIATVLVVVVGSAAWIARDSGWSTSPARTPVAGPRPPATPPNEASGVSKANEAGGTTAGEAGRAVVDAPVASATPPSPEPAPAPVQAPPEDRLPQAVGATPMQAATRPATPAAEADGPRTAAPPPAIARIDVPAVVEGAPFVVAVHLATELGDVASIERRFVDRSGSWVRSPAVLPIAGLRRDGRDAVLVPFRAMDATSRATVEFRAVSRDGSRSPPKVATITVAAPTRSGATLADTASCTPETCGTVVEAREIEPEIGTRPAIYQMIVRLGDQRTLAFRAPYRFQSGSRVRSADGRFVPAD